MLRKTVTTLGITALMVTGALGITMAQDEPTDTPERPPRVLQVERELRNLSVIADVFGMSIDELASYVDGGGTLADLAEEQGIDVETIQEALQAARQEALIERVNQALADGELTQEQHDAIIAGIESGLDFSFGQRGERGRSGPGRPGRGNFGFGFFNQDAPDTNTDTSTDS